MPGRVLQPDEHPLLIRNLEQPLRRHPQTALHQIETPTLDELEVRSPLFIGRRRCQRGRIVAPVQHASNGKGLAVEEELIAFGSDGSEGNRE